MPKVNMTVAPIYNEPRTIANVASLFSCSGRQKHKGTASKGSERVTYVHDLYRALGKARSDQGVG